MRGAAAAPRPVHDIRRWDAKALLSRRTGKLLRLTEQRHLSSSLSLSLDSFLMFGGAVAFGHPVANSPLGAPCRCPLPHSGLGASALSILCDTTTRCISTKTRFHCRGVIARLDGPQHITIFPIQISFVITSRFSFVSKPKSRKPSHRRARAVIITATQIDPAPPPSCTSIHVHVEAEGERAGHSAAKRS